MTCPDCGSKKIGLKEGAYKGVGYIAYKCQSCGEETFTLDQAKTLVNAAQEARQVTFSKWGETLAVRIPAAVVRRFHLKPKSKGKLIEDGGGFKIIPSA